MKIKFIPIDKEIEVKAGESVLHAAQDNDIHIHSVCKGIPSCAECRVEVVEGAENLLPPMENELDLIGTAHFVDRRRLSCQMRCFGNVTVDLTEQMEKAQDPAKQPQGRAAKKEGEESFARMGNILEESPANPEELDKAVEEAKKAESAEQKKKPNNKKRRNNRNRNRNKNKNKSNENKKQ